MLDQRPDPRSIGKGIRQLREGRQLSMRELAAKSGVSASMISKVESGRASPTVMSLQRLLEALEVDLYEFFLHRSNPNPTEQVLFRKSAMVASEDAEHVWYYAFPRHPDIKAELTYEEFQPHTTVVEKEAHRGDLCGLVISGELMMEVNGKGALRVCAGDAFYLKAGAAHVTRNDGDRILKLVAVQLR